MNAPIRTLLPTIVLALMTTAVAADGLPPETVGPVILRVKGVVEPAPEAARHTNGFAVLSLGFLGGGPRVRRWLGVDDARTLGRDDSPEGKDVLEMVAPFEPNLFVAGPPDLIAELRDARPGTALDIEGLVERDSRIYYLRRVEHRAAM